ncbi:MAG: hypothetical protein M1814_003619 [Vezdaea aestivalis]|nr:MAG: hypothetical protein M1814_003619 [Vezdaea aestivalis]
MDDLYDEFGNYIGEEEESEEEQEQHGAAAAAAYLSQDDSEDEPEQNDQQLMELDDNGPSNAVVLHEDKQYYPTAQQVYGNDVETMVQEEDAQPLSEPIIAPVDKRKFTIQEADLPEVYFDRGFMSDLLNFPEQIRNIAFAGHLHHGKTALMDMLVLETHNIADRLEKRTGKKRDEQLRYTDVHFLERARGLSVKAAPMSLVLQSTKGKSHLINVLDTPGHVNFVDEVACSLRLVDGIVLVVDVVEGVQANTEKIIKHVVLENLPLTLLINKVDRLILELRLPPNDAYFKLKHVIEEVNTVIENTIPGRGSEWRVSPEKGNVAFASSNMKWCFTLSSFATMYASSYPSLSPKDFARRLWGDIFFNPRTRKFVRKGVDESARRTFVSFVLDPIYKLYSHTLSSSPTELAQTLSSLGIQLKPSQLRSDARDLLQLVCAQFFGPATGLVDMVVQHIPSPLEGATRMLDQYYKGPADAPLTKSMRACDPEGPLVIHVTKLFSTSNARGFHAFGRVLSGTVRPSMPVRVLGEAYSLDDDEDMAVATVGEVLLAETRYAVPTSGVPAGNWVLLGGVDNSMVKTATVVANKLEDDEDVFIFAPIRHMTESVFKVAVEPINPSELPKMLDGLRKINKSYGLVTTKVEESGEHIVLGTGELYMDCVLHDLRRLYADMELKVSDPVTRFCETVVETSAVKCSAKTPNGKNQISLLAEPLDDGLAEDIESGKISLRSPMKKVVSFFQENYGWDLLASRGIWAFGPEDRGPNILQDDTLPGETDKKLLGSVKETIRQGFNWGTREGPLCEERKLGAGQLCLRRLLVFLKHKADIEKTLLAIRNTKFRITDISLASEAIFRGGGQIIPSARRACYSSFLMASPRLMEPLYACSVTAPSDVVSTLYSVLMKRRGHVLTEEPIAGTPLQIVKGLIPVIDSFGFETDLKIQSQGRASISLVFDRWSIVPGDPLDRDVGARPMEAAGPGATARDFVLKTRRRKGLSEDVGVGKYLEEDTRQSLREQGLLAEG